MHANIPDCPFHIVRKFTRIGIARAASTPPAAAASVSSDGGARLHQLRSTVEACLASPQSSDRCWTCGVLCGAAKPKPLPRLVCQRCRRAVYCSKECQKSDWGGESGHKVECGRGVQAPAPAGPKLAVTV